MAFATTNIRKNVFGSLKVTHGDWSGSAADASGTITVEGGRVYLAEFTSQDAANGPTQEVPVSVSTSGMLATVTVHNRQTVSTGRFLIIHA
jgi:hypothetical protein